MTGDGQTDSNEILGSHRDLVVAEEILRVFPSLDHHNPLSCQEDPSFSFLGRLGR